MEYDNSANHTSQSSDADNESDHEIVTSDKVISYSYIQELVLFNSKF